MDVGDIDIENCKSRAIRLEEYHVARGESDRAFIHLQVCIFEGRSLSVKQLMGKNLLKILGECYLPSLEALNLQITLEIKDVQKALYFKLPAVKDC
jgi:5-carboxymethyl-2-hydroxymuconate isomerase